MGKYVDNVMCNNLNNYDMPPLSLYSAAGHCLQQAITNNCARQQWSLPSVHPGKRMKPSEVPCLPVSPDAESATSPYWWGCACFMCLQLYLDCYGVLLKESIICVRFSQKLRLGDGFLPTTGSRATGMNMSARAINNLPYVPNFNPTLILKP